MAEELSEDSELQEQIQFLFALHDKQGFPNSALRTRRRPQRCVGDGTVARASVLPMLHDRGNTRLRDPDLDKKLQELDLAGVATLGQLLEGYSFAQESRSSLLRNSARWCSKLKGTTIPMRSKRRSGYLISTAPATSP